jgi:hypothetical protein
MPRGQTALLRYTHGICPTRAAGQVGQPAGVLSGAGRLSAPQAAPSSARDSARRAESPPRRLREGQPSCAACRSRRRSRARAHRSTVPSPGPPPLRQIAARSCRQVSMWRAGCGGDSKRPNTERMTISPTSTSSTSTGLTCLFTARLPSRLRSRAVPLPPRTASHGWRANGTLQRSVCWIGPSRGQLRRIPLRSPVGSCGLLWPCRSRPGCHRRPAVNFSSPQGV